MGNHIPYGITRCYLPPSSGDFPAFIGVQLPVREIYLSRTNHPDQLILAIPPCVGAMSAGQRAVMLCNWE